MAFLAFKKMGCSSRADDADVYERRYIGVATHDVNDGSNFAVAPMITYGREGSGATWRQEGMSVLHHCLVLKRR